MYKFDHRIDQNLKFPPYTSLAYFLIIVFFGYFFGSMVSLLVVILPKAGFDLAGAEYISQHIIEQPALTCLAIQGVWLFTAFVITPLLYFQFIEHKTVNDLSHPKVSSQKQWPLFLTGLVFILSVYPISLLLRDFTVSAVDSGLLGDAGKAILVGEKGQLELIEAMLNVHTLFEYLVLLFVISIIPALGEELVFRGVIQNIFLKAQINPHLSILVTAVIFSAMHMNLTDFLPRVLLGAVLGYAYYYSKNFWVPVFLHFANNALSVLYYVLLENGTITFDIEAKGQMTPTIVIIGILLTVVSWWFFQKEAKKDLNNQI